MQGLVPNQQAVLFSRACTAASLKGHEYLSAHLRSSPKRWYLSSAGGCCVTGRMVAACLRSHTLDCLPVASLLVCCVCSLSTPLSDLGLSQPQTCDTHNLSVTSVSPPPLRLPDTQASLPAASKRSRGTTLQILTLTHCALTYFLFVPFVCECRCSERSLCHTAKLKAWDVCGTLDLD